MTRSSATSRSRCERLVELVPEAQRAAPRPRPEPGEPPQSDPLSGSEAMAALADAWPQNAIAVVETPSCTLSLRNRLRISSPGSYYFCASGGLGFGIAAAVGVQLAQPDRPVVCVLGEGSAQYGITALWTAVAYRVPVTFLVLRNDEYAILKWFAMLEQVGGAPGLDLPGLDVAAVARGYGMQAHEVSGREQLTGALRDAIAADDGPRLRAGAGRVGNVAGVMARASLASRRPAGSPPNSLSRPPIEHRTGSPRGRRSRCARGWCRRLAPTRS